MMHEGLCEIDTTSNISKFAMAKSVNPIFSSRFAAFDNRLWQLLRLNWIFEFVDESGSINSCLCTVLRRATRGEFAPPEIFKTLHSKFDICSNFQRIKMKFYILIIFKILYANFSLSSWLFLSSQDLSWNRPSDRKFRKWLVFNHKYAGSVNMGDSLKCSYFKGIFYLFVCVLFCLRLASICLHEIL